MNINIKPNDYKEVTECREEVVQGICDAFLNPCIWSDFHPRNGSPRCRFFTNYIVRHKNDEKFYGFTSRPEMTSDICVEIHRCEVELAIKLLQKAGYYLYRYYLYGSWVTYCISGNPRLTDKQRVDKIYDYDWSGYFK